MKKSTTTNWQVRLACASIATVVFMFAAISFAGAQVAIYNTGDKIEVLYGSSWYKAEILEAKTGSYKIRYDGYGSSWDEWVTPAKIRRIGENSPSATQNKSDARESLFPKMAGGLPSIPGTGWKIDFGKGVTGYVYLFCKSPHWEVISPDLLRGAATLMGTYKVQGSILMSRDGTAGRVTPFKMAWKDGVLLLNDGKVPLKLHYNGESQCK